MPASILLALLFVALCLAAGRVVLRLLGATRPTWLAGAVGFATLTIAAALLVRMPGRAATAAAVIVLALAVGLVAIRRSLVPASAPRPAGAAHLGALAVVAIVIAVGSIPFWLSGHGGVLGEGIYTNDHAAQLYWTDWLQNGFGPEPSAVAFGYPVGPQSLVAVVAEATGASLIDAFNGLLLAIAALTALTALSLLGGLRPLARVAAAALAGLPFLGASFLAQSAFKETAMALLVLAFAATLALGTNSDGGRGPDLNRRAAVGSAALVALAGVFAYSVPALIWFALTGGGWLAVLFVAGDQRLDWGALRGAISRRRVPLALIGIVVLGIAAVTAGSIAGFSDRIGDVQASTGRLISPVFPGEALGLWPQGDFRVVRGEVPGALVGSAVGLAALAAGALVTLRNRGYALLAAVGAGVGVYLWARAFASIYVEAKALAVLAPLVIVVALGGLFSAQGRHRRVLAAFGAVVAVAATASTLLALREAPVGFGARGAELEQLAERVDGKTVAFLGVDRFGGYWLRGTLIRSPGGYVPAEVRARPEKVWQQGDAMDLDTLPSRRLDEFRYAITTTAAYQSSPPRNMREVARTDSFILWAREGATPRLGVLPGEGSDPGVRADCPFDGAGPRPETGAGPEAEAEATADDVAAVLPRPVVGEKAQWSRVLPFQAPGSASQSLPLRPGRWQLSLQYNSQVDLTAEASGLETELPASLAGMYRAHQGGGSFWPVGEIAVGSGGPVEVTVVATEPNALERAVGAPRRVWLGRLAASRFDATGGSAPGITPLDAACGSYVDHFGADAALANFTP
ncbi:MAG: hypothetical protein ABI726_02885 [bacterium]